MMKEAVLMVSLLLTGQLVAQAGPVQPTSVVGVASHVVRVTGIPEGEGRTLRVELIDNNQYKSGYYFCAGAHDIAYAFDYSAKVSDEPFYLEHFIKFSICQDETLAQCQEFATDKYLTFRNKSGYLENDVSKVHIDSSVVAEAFQNCVPNSNAAMDELVKKSIHISNRHFAGQG
ncbi:MAG: hypothetical protein ACHP65_05695 [Legionellales bacterium]